MEQYIMYKINFGGESNNDISVYCRNNGLTTLNFTSLMPSPITNTNTWYDLEMVYLKNTYQILVNGEAYLEATDNDNPINIEKPARIQLYSRDGYSHGFDDVLLTKETVAKSFPTAEGYGAYAVGGRGGDVYYVENIEDYNPETDVPIPGSLRYGIRSAEGPRTILFQTSGNIELKQALLINKPYITIAGQTSLNGICIKDYPTFILGTHDIVIRFLRFRLGNDKELGDAGDCLTILCSRDVIIDHCSMSWSNDETSSVGSNSDNITFQWSIVSEALYPHSAGSLLGDQFISRLSYHHNIYAHNDYRNPRTNNFTKIDWRNNVTYNWGYQCLHTVGSPRVNFVNNYVVVGPSLGINPYHPAIPPERIISGENGYIYFSGNFSDQNVNGVRDGIEVFFEESVPGGGGNRPVLMDIPHSAPEVTTTTAEEAYYNVLAMAGASFPQRDSIDIRIVDEIQNDAGAIITDPNDVGGWPAIGSNLENVISLLRLLSGVENVKISIFKDSDKDGMPDDWELSKGLNPSDGKDGNKLSTSNGYFKYTNLEEYLNELRHRKEQGIKIIDIDGDNKLGLEETVYHLRKLSGF